MMKALPVTLLAILLGAATALAQKPAKADDVLQPAEVKATAQNKAIFLIFGASWCEACHQLDKFLDNPEVAGIFDKYFAIARVSFGEAAAGHPERDNPGSGDLITKYGGLPPGGGQVGLPFIAVLDKNAKLMVNSNEPGQPPGKAGNVDFATDPDETRVFLGMLKKGAPGLTDEEMRRIQDALHQAAIPEGAATK
jgi:thioredoxin-related protein